MYSPAHSVPATMPYISKVYKDTSNLDEYATESTKEDCLNEINRGNLPIVIHWGKRNITLFGSPDVSINDILTSLREKNHTIKTVTKVQVMIYDEKKEHRSSKIITDLQSKIQDIIHEKNIQIVVWSLGN